MKNLVVRLNVRSDKRLLRSANSTIITEITSNISKNRPQPFDLGCFFHFCCPSHSKAREKEEEDK